MEVHSRTCDMRKHSQTTYITFIIYCQLIVWFLHSSIYRGSVKLNEHPTSIGQTNTFHSEIFGQEGGGHIWVNTECGKSYCYLRGASIKEVGRVYVGGGQVLRDWVHDKGWGGC